MAKGLAGGVPIGALLTFGPQVSGLLTAGQHGSTFGGNPLACAAGLATIGVIEGEGLRAHAAALGTYLVERVMALGHPAHHRRPRTRPAARDPAHRAGRGFRRGRAHWTPASSSTRLRPTRYGSPRRWSSRRHAARHLHRRVARHPRRCGLMLGTSRTARQARVSQLLEGAADPLPGRAARAARGGRHRRHPGHALTRPGRARGRQGAPRRVARLRHPGGRRAAPGERHASARLRAHRRGAARHCRRARRTSSCCARRQGRRSTSPRPSTSLIFRTCWARSPGTTPSCSSQRVRPAGPGWLATCSP